MANMERNKLTSLVPAKNSLDVAAKGFSKMSLISTKGISGSIFISIIMSDDLPEN
ncbi:hypothetical protein SDC9_126325 [bioreactor metagenome]|uniref:Uncharacterized protein n=1 Tax=bioreactor metagenome TaxID=1076179 RepID=A0A645CRE5_9ZZZZ